MEWIMKWTKTAWSLSHISSTFKELYWANRNIMLLMTEEEQKGLKLFSLYLVLGTLLGKKGTIIGHNSNIIEKKEH